MLRGKESSNRIDLSQLAQDLLNFIDLGVFLLGVDGMAGSGYVRGVPCTHTHAHAYTCKLNIIMSCKWLPLWGNPSVNLMMSYICPHACMCMHAWDTPTHTHECSQAKNLQTELIYLN